MAALQTLSSEGSASRADIARSTGLTKASVSSLVAELIDEGLVSELGTAPSEGGGKPPTMLAVNPRGRDIVAVDLSCHPAEAALVDLTGAVHFRTHADAAHLEGEALLTATEALIAACIEQSSAPLLGIGVGTPGIIDPEGTIVEASNLGWHNVALRSRLRERFGLPVSVANDSHAAALAEYRVHPNADESLLLLNIGEGIGAGLVIDGALHTGDRFAAGEIGHVVVDADGPHCRCGNRGCLETVAAVPAIVQAVTGAKTDAPWDALALAAGFGDSAVRAAIEESGRSIGAAVAHVVSMLDVTHVVVSTELRNAADVFLGAIRAELRRRVHPSTAALVAVDSASTTGDLVLLGAAAIVLRDELGLVLR